MGHNRIRMSYRGERDWIENHGGPVLVRDDNDNHHMMFHVPWQMYWVDIPGSGGLLKTNFHPYDDKPSGTEGVDFYRATLGGFLVDMFQNSHPSADAMICHVDSVVGNDQFTCERLAKDSDTDWGSPKAAVTFLSGSPINETKEVATYNSTTGEMTFGAAFTGVSQGDRILIATKGWEDASKTTQPAVGSTIARSKPMRIPWCYMDLPDAKTVCAARGSGFNLLMNHQWMDLVTLCILNGWIPLGNNDGSNGPSTPPRSNTDNDVEWLVDPTGRVLNSSYNRALVGSGGPQSGHNLSLAGVLDLNGNVWEWVDGLYLSAGNIFVSRKPNPTYPGDYIDTGLNIQNGGLVTSDQDIKSLRFEDDLKGLGVPHESAASSDNFDNDHIWYNTADIRAAGRGGDWDTDSGEAGVSALYLSSGPSYRRHDFSFRASLEN